MINQTIRKQIFPFFGSVKSPITAAGTSDSFHNTCFGSMTIEFALSTGGAISAKIQGCTNITNTDGSTKSDDECTWSDLAVVSLKDLTVKASGITEGGHYSFAIGGYMRVRVVISSITGNATVVGVAEE